MVVVVVVVIVMMVMVVMVVSGIAWSVIRLRLVRLTVCQS